MNGVTPAGRKALPLTIGGGSVAAVATGLITYLSTSESVLGIAISVVALAVVVSGALVWLAIGGVYKYQQDFAQQYRTELVELRKRLYAAEGRADAALARAETAERKGDECERRCELLRRQLEALER